jgi:hypothetical protein
VPGRIRYRAEGPLADLRGPRGRAVALRTAIVEALAAGTDVEEAIVAAAAEGADVPGLFDLPAALRSPDGLINVG